MLIKPSSPNEQRASLPEFLDGLRESIGASLRELIAEHDGLQLLLGVDDQYRHMSEVRIAVAQLTTHRDVLHNDLQINQVIARLE